MSKSLKVTLIALAACVLLAGVAVFLLSRVDARSPFEALVSEATGLEVAVNGSLSVGLFPSPHVALKDVTLKNKESQIASVGEADVGLELWPLLRKQVRIKRLDLRNVNVEIERDRDGHFNFARSSQKAEGLMPAMKLGRVSLAKATFRYNNRQLEKEFKATDCRFDSNGVQLAEGSAADIMKHLSFSARVVCAEMRNDRFTGADVRFSTAGDRGIFKLAPLTMRTMGGKGAGTIDADFSGAVPTYRVHYAVTRMQVNDLFKSLDKTKAPSKVGEGFMNFTADLSVRGFDSAEMTRTAHGEASLRGEDIDIAIGNLDEKLSRYESSQNFNLIDVGAFFIAGPVGTAVTKGYDFASIFKEAGGNTHVRLLVSHWKVENGIAHAQDVAMATKENRLAMKGALDFVNQDFDDVTVAILDGKGCARIEQKIRGPFSKPEVAKPNVLVSLTGPIGSLIDKAKKLVGAKCDVFYEGAVSP